MSQVADFLKNTAMIMPVNSGMRSFHGTIFEYGLPGKITPDSFPKLGQLKECFLNASRLANKGKGIYCEGFAMGVIPVLHAWCIDEQGNVIDPTWHHGTEYHGIPFKTDYIRKAMVDRGYWSSVVDDWKMGYPLLRTTFDIDSAIHPIRNSLIK